MTQYTKKADFTREQPMHPPKVPAKPNPVVVLAIWGPLC